MGNKKEIDWSAVSSFFIDTLEELTASTLSPEELTLAVDVHMPATGETLSVKIPPYLAEDFLKRLPIFEARVTKG